MMTMRRRKSIRLRSRRKIGVIATSTCVARSRGIFGTECAQRAASGSIESLRFEP
jgi:hypothetical protein